MYDISLRLAAIKFSLMFSNSEISLTTTPDRFFLKKIVGYKRKLGPCVPQYIYWMTIDFSFNSASFLHQSYHCGMLLWCQMNNKGTITRVQGLWLPLCVTCVKLWYIALHGLASISFHKSDYSISPFYILNIATTLLSPTELGQCHYIDGTCSCYCRLFCVPPE